LGLLERKVNKFQKYPLERPRCQCYMHVKEKSVAKRKKIPKRQEHPMATAKFKALVHFMVHECRESPGKLGAIRLNKSLWYTDVAAYRSSGASVTNEVYVKRRMGPVPSHILQTIEELKAEGKVHVREPAEQYDSRKFISLVDPDPGVLSDDEKSLARSVLSAVLGHTANAISEMTHDIIWDAAEDGEEIPMYATLASERGAITEDVKAWARSILEPA
jgi:hypothetical protein